MELRHLRFGAVVALCSMVGFLGAISVPATADTPSDLTGNINPDDRVGDGQKGCGAAGTHCATSPDGSGSYEEAILSDLTVTNSYQFRATASTDTTAVGAYLCADGGDPSTATPGGACDLMGTSTTPKTLIAPVGTTAAEAYTMGANFDATGGQEGGPLDTWAVACAHGVAPGLPADTTHCLNEQTANDVHVDDVQSTGDHTASTGGRFWLVGTATCTGANVHGCGFTNQRAATFQAIVTPGGIGAADAVSFCGNSETTPFSDRDDTPDPSSAATGATAGSCDVFAVDTSPSAGPVAGTDLFEVTFPAGQLVSDTNYTFSATEVCDASAADGITASGRGDAQGCAGTPGDDVAFDAIAITTVPQGDVTPGPGPGPGPAPACLGRRIVGNAKDNVKRGTCGPDRFTLKAGDDKGIGRAGNDVINCGEGRENEGGDVGRGGGGLDRFRNCEKKVQGARV